MNKKPSRHNEPHNSLEEIIGISRYIQEIIDKDEFLENNLDDIKSYCKRIIELIEEPS